MAAISVLVGAELVYSKQAVTRQQPAARGGVQQAPVLLFTMALRNDVRQPLSQKAVATPNVDVQLYGDGQNIILAVGDGPNFPRTFFGLCEKPCGFTLRDRTNYFDLRGRANIRFTTIVSGFHRVRPIVKLADGTLLIGDQAEGSVADYHQYQISFSECRWLKLDPLRGVTLGARVENVDLSKVDEVGYFDVIPGSGVHADGVAVEKLPAPPVGGWIAVSSFELWGQAVSRNLP